MRINCIATGSSGNLYEIIDSQNNCILIEAGVDRSVFAKYRESEKVPEMCIISHKHGDHSFFANNYEMICPVHKWQPTAESENFKAFGFHVEHGGVLTYSYLIKFLADDDFLFFATDLEYEEKSISLIVDTLKKFSVKKYLIEVNYNDYLYHLADDLQRIGCDRHFSDNDLVRFIRKIGVKDPTIITIHGSNRLSADSYTRKFIQGKLPASKVAVSVGGKNGVKNIFKL